MTESLVVLSQVDRQLTVLERATGRIVWRRRFGENIGSGPLVDYDRIYFATQTNDGTVRALNLEDGKVVWTRTLGDVAAPIAVRGDQLYAGTVGGAVAALSTAGGGELWRTQLAGGVRAAPLALESGVVVATAADSLYLLDRSTGTVRARRPTWGTVLAAPALADSVIVLGTTRGRLEACDTATLAARWSLDLGSEVIGAVAVQQDTAYVVTGAGDLWWVPLAAPDHSFRIALGLVARGGPTPVAGGVLVVSVGGDVALVSAAGERRWTAKVHPPVVQPVIAAGPLIVAVSERGDVVAFK